MKDLLKDSALASLKMDNNQNINLEESKNNKDNNINLKESKSLKKTNANINKIKIEDEDFIKSENKENKKKI